MDQMVEVLHFAVIKTVHEVYEKMGLVTPMISATTEHNKKIMLCAIMKTPAEAAKFKEQAHIILAVNRAVIVSFSCGAMYSKDDLPVKGVSVTTYNKEGSIIQDHFAFLEKRLKPIDVPLCDIEFSELLSPLTITPEMEQIAQASKKEDWYIGD